MNDFFKQFLNSEEINVPQVCIEAFSKNFDGAVSVEWFDTETYFEAIFYKDQMEYIADFNKLGKLVEYKMHLPVEYLPEAIKITLENRGEIMNAVLKNKGNSIEYETIVRDNQLARKLIIITDLGKVIEEKQL